MGQELASSVTTAPCVSVSPCKLRTLFPGTSRRERGGKILCKGGGKGELLSKARRKCGLYLQGDGGIKQFSPLGSLSGHHHVLTVSSEGCELFGAGTVSIACMPWGQPGRVLLSPSLDGDSEALRNVCLSHFPLTIWGASSPRESSS